VRILETRSKCVLGISSRKRGSPWYQRAWRRWRSAGSSGGEVGRGKKNVKRPAVTSHCRRRRSVVGIVGRWTACGC
jgi:hypothetical protein